jgi:hypothetical protein
MIVEGAHLVGSVPLENADTVFRTVVASLGRHLHTLPDGETGPRKDWIAWQYGVLARSSGLVPVPIGDRGYLRRQLVALHGSRAAPAIGPLGYADAAVESFAIFDRLQREGVIPPHVRFQVSLPTPLAPITVFVSPGDRAIVEPAYEARMRAELGRIVDVIPHQRLAIQWDIAVEIGLLEGTWPAHFEDVPAGVRERLARLAAIVPRDVALGFHLCYGDFGHHHFMQPVDASTLVYVANMLGDFPRHLQWVHMPIPLGWTERAAVQPFEELELPPSTQLYLGVVHVADGIEGTQRRIRLVGEVVPRFGIATECGWGRRSPETIRALLDMHDVLLASRAQ